MIWTKKKECHRPISHYIDTTHGYSVDGSRKRYALRHFVSFIFTAN